MRQRVVLGARGFCSKKKKYERTGLNVAEKRKMKRQASSRRLRWPSQFLSTFMSGRDCAATFIPYGRQVPLELLSAAL
jgi:hypothetical protein